MDAKRKTMLIAAFAVAIIALAGVGYAAYTSTTSAPATTAAQNAYVSVGLDDYDAKQMKIYYNTQNSSSGISYQFESSSTLTYKVTIGNVNPDDGTVLSLVISGLTATNAPNGTKLSCEWGASGSETSQTISNTGTVTINPVTAGTYNLKIKLIVDGEAGWTTPSPTAVPSNAITVSALSFNLTATPAA